MANFVNKIGLIIFVLMMHNKTIVTANKKTPQKNIVEKKVANQTVNQNNKNNGKTPVKVEEKKPKPAVKPAVNNKKQPLESKQIENNNIEQKNDNVNQGDILINQILSFIDDMCQTYNNPKHQHKFDIYYNINMNKMTVNLTLNDQLEIDYNTNNNDKNDYIFSIDFPSISDESILEFDDCMLSAKGIMNQMIMEMTKNINDNGASKNFQGLLNLCLQKIHEICVLIQHYGKKDPLKDKEQLKEIINFGLSNQEFLVVFLQIFPAISASIIQNILLKKFIFSIVQNENNEQKNNATLMEITKFLLQNKKNLAFLNQLVTKMPVIMITAGEIVSNNIEEKIKTILNTEERKQIDINQKKQKAAIFQPNIDQSTNKKTSMKKQYMAMLNDKTHNQDVEKYIPSLTKNGLNDSHYVVINSKHINDDLLNKINTFNDDLPFHILTTTVNLTNGKIAEKGQLYTYIIPNQNVNLAKFIQTNTLSDKKILYKDINELSVESINNILIGCLYRLIPIIIQENEIDMQFIKTFGLIDSKTKEKTNKLISFQSYDNLKSEFLKDGAEILQTLMMANQQKKNGNDNINDPIDEFNDTENYDF